MCEWTCMCIFRVRQCVSILCFVAQGLRRECVKVKAKFGELIENVTLWKGDLKKIEGRYNCALNVALCASRHVFTLVYTITRRLSHKIASVTNNVFNL